MTCHYPDLGSASDWSCRVGNLIQPIRSTTQIWVVTRHQYGISALISQTSFRGETCGGVAKSRLFSQGYDFALTTAEGMGNSEMFFFFFLIISLSVLINPKWKRRSRSILNCKFYLAPFLPYRCNNYYPCVTVGFKE